MTVALSIPELFEQICSYSDNASLAAMARTCFGWQDIALDVLWEHLPAWLPLFKLLPSDAWEVRHIWEWTGSTEFPVDRFVLLRPLTDSDWTRVLAYSKRVRFATLDNSYYHIVFPFGNDKKAPGFLGSDRPPADIFSKLRSLQISAFGTHYHLKNTLKVFFRESDLLQLQLRTDPRTTASLSILTSGIDLFNYIGSSYEKLQSFKWNIVGDLWNGKPCAISETFLVNLRACQTLEIPRLTEAAFVYAASLQHLHTLVVSCSTSEPFPLLQHPQHCFPSLSTVNLNVNSLSIFASFIQSLGSHEYSELSISVQWDPTDRELDDFSQALDTLCNHHSLQVLHVRWLAPLGCTTEDLAGSKCTAAFRHFHNLRSFTMSFKMVNVKIRMDALHDLLRCYPRLEELRFIPLYSQTNTKREFAADISQFAQFCKELKHVELPIDVLDVETRSGGTTAR